MDHFLSLFSGEDPMTWARAFAVAFFGVLTGFWVCLHVFFIPKSRRILRCLSYTIYVAVGITGILMSITTAATASHPAYFGFLYVLLVVMSMEMFRRTIGHFVSSRKSPNKKEPTHANHRDHGTR